MTAATADENEQSTQRSLEGRRVLITGGAGTIGSTIADQLGRAGRGEIVVLDNLVRGRQGQPGLGAGATGRSRSSKATSVTGRPWPRPRAASTSSSTRPPSASPSAPRSRASRSRCWSTAPSTSSKRPSPSRCSKVVAASSASVYGMADVFPTDEDHHPYGNRTFYGAAKIFNEGAAPQLPRDVRARLRGPALLQRLRAAHGHLRRLHRGARPLDGADRGRRRRR